MREQPAGGSVASRPGDRLVSLPALTLAYVHAVKFEPTLAFAALMAWVLFAFGVAFFWLIGRVLGCPAPPLAR